MGGGKKWLAQYIATDGERDDWFIDPRGSSRRPLSLLCLGFSGCLCSTRSSPTRADNVLTWHRVVIVAELVA